MEGGDLFTLLFWGVIILLSILQSATKGKKTRPGPRRQPGTAGAEGEAPVLFEPVDAEGPDESAASMIPDDVWDEIAGLAGGASGGTKTRVEPEPVPTRQGGTHGPPYRSRAQIEAARRERERERIRREREEIVQERAPEVVSRGRTPTTGLPATLDGPSLPATSSEHPIHLSHPGYGTDPSSRRSARPPREAPTAGSETAAARDMLRSGGVESLRRAFILREVLGSPRGLD